MQCNGLYIYSLWIYTKCVSTSCFTHPEGIHDGYIQGKEKLFDLRRQWRRRSYEC